jgi:hypothetical protein
VGEDSGSYTRSITTPRGPVPGRIPCPVPPPAVLAASPENLLNGMLLASMAVRSISGAALQGRPPITITVTPRPLSVGRTRMWM